MTVPLKKSENANFCKKVSKCKLLKTIHYCLCVNYKNENVKTAMSCICVLRVQSTEMHKCADVQYLQSGIANYWPDVHITAFL